MWHCGSCESLSVSQFKAMSRFVDAILEENDDGDYDDRAAVVRYFQALVRSRAVSACCAG